MTSPFCRFTNNEVREILRGAGLTDELNDENAAQIGLVRIRSQRQLVIEAYRRNPDVDAIWNELGRAVPKSSIRSILCRLDPHGDWRQRRRRKDCSAFVDEAERREKAQHIADYVLRGER